VFLKMDISGSWNLNAVLCLFVCLQGKLPARQQVWGETLDPDKPSVDTIAAAVANANGNGADAAAGGRGVTNTVRNARGNNANPYDKLMQLGTPGAPGGVTNTVSNTVSNGSADMAAQNIVDAWEEEEGARDEDVTAGQTWMVLEYCDRGCLQVRFGVVHVAEDHGALGRP
jgi:hypothetical protein